MSPARVLAILCVLGLGAWLVWSLARDDRPEGSERIAFRSSLDCRSCHEDVFAEWERSEHATAWTGAEVRALSLEFSNPACIECHAPAPIFVSGIGQRVRPRNVRQVDGVDYLSCHLLPDGGVAAGRTIPDAPCRPTHRPELASPDSCASCHNQHRTVDQWHTSRYSQEGMACIHCHMPEVTRAGGRAGRSHVSAGGADMAFVRAALALRGAREGDRWVVEVENVGVGHTFPTDERSRAADLFWRAIDADGAPVGPWRHFYRFRDPYRQEVDLPTTLLEPHEVRRLPVLDDASRVHRHTVEPQGAPVQGAIEVALFYKRSPYYADPEAPDPEREARLVHSVRLVP